MTHGEDLLTTIDAIGTSFGSKTTLAGAGAGVVGWASQMDWLGLTGVFCAVIGLLINLYFQLRRDRREAAESNARIKSIEEHSDESLK
jgi:Bacteriophage holin family, superfamily II-like